MSPLRTSLLDIRDDCRVCILPNIRQKNRRDVDGTLGTSALCFEGYNALCREAVGKFRGRVPPQYK